MSKSDTWESDLLKLLFNNTTAALIGDATGIVGSTGVGSLYVSLHTADPGETGTQATSEATYTGYGRIAVARTAGGWTISGTAPTQAANTATILFAACTAGANTITYFGVGTASAGAGKLLYSGALTASLAVSNGITPQFAAGGLVVTED